ncbi:hypothetical protein P8935_21975 [Telmatobacter sp. DSM 110680]|uniref:Uncharacterized protein n=1 Tax=Telmatobacter sp. DSM 110680 TaxID=3036704 RepID=A0AAU7DJF6_9BACT
MAELWIGVAEVLTDPSSGDGDTRAFTNVIVWATSVSTFFAKVTSVFSEYGWTVLGTENVRPVGLEVNFDEEITEIIERAKTNPNACIFATLHYYPSKPA